MTSDQIPQAARQLMQLMQKQLQLIDGYIEYLDEIKHSVSENNIERLNQLLVDKSPNLHLIEQIQQQQGSLLSNQGFSNSHQGLEDFIDTSHLAALKELKTRLNERLQKLEKSLLVNDLLIRKNQSRVRQSIRLLSGHDQANRTATYSRDGNTDEDSDNQRTLAQV